MAAKPLGNLSDHRKAAPFHANARREDDGEANDASSVDENEGRLRKK